MFLKFFATLLLPLGLYGASPPYTDDDLGVLEVIPPIFNALERFSSTLKLSFSSTEVADSDVTQTPRIQTLPGEVCLSTSQTFQQIRIEDSECGIRVSSGKTTLVGIAAVRFQWDPKDFKTHLGLPLSLVMDQKYAFDPADEPSTRTYLALHARRLNMELAVGERFLHEGGRVSESLIPGQTNIIPIKFPEVRSRLKVEKVPATFPNAYASCGSDVLVQSVDGKIVPVASAEGHYFYVEQGLTIWVNTQGADLETHPGQTTDLRIQRIEVKDVLINHDDGSSEYIKGQYRVFQRDAQGEVVGPPLRKLVFSSLSECQGVNDLESFPTQTGLDVLPGRYRVIIDFVTKAGPQSEIYDVEVR